MKKSFFILFILGCIAILNVQASNTFIDVTKDGFYEPHIQRLYDQNLITGHKNEKGDPSGYFKPDDAINRAEFSKMVVTPRLAEVYGVAQNWASKNANAIESIMDQYLLPYYNCSDYICSENKLSEDNSCQNITQICQSISGNGFSDVPFKSRWCDHESTTLNACDPWYSQFVYYAVKKGYVKGYDHTSQAQFGPSDKIIRIHALKMILSDRGDIDGVTDGRYQRLYNLTLSNDSHHHKCLAGAENYILKNNGGDTVNSNRLLEYALLADRLDFFGNECQFFDAYKAYGPEQRANLLQQPLTRKEAARYLAIASDYDPINPNWADDDTLNTASENKDKLASTKGYVVKSYEQALGDGDLKSDTNTNASLLGNCQLGDNSCSSSFTGLNPNPSAPHSNNSEGNLSSGGGSGPLDDLRQKRDNGHLLTINEYALLSEKGRCFDTRNDYPDGRFKVVRYSDYYLPESPDKSNPMLRQATLKTNASSFCFISFTDIMWGYDGPGTKEIDLSGSVANGERLVVAGIDVIGLGYNALRAAQILESLNHYLKTSNQEATAFYFIKQYDQDSWERVLIYSWYVAKIYEIPVNLDAYHANNHTLEQTRDMGLTNKSVGTNSYKAVINWYETNKKIEGISGDQLRKDLDNYFKTHSQEDTRNHIIDLYAQGSWQYKLINDWYAEKLAQIPVNLDKYYSAGNSIEDTKNIGLINKKNGDPSYEIVIAWYNLKKSTDIEEVMTIFSQPILEYDEEIAKKEQEIRYSVENYKKQEGFLDFTGAFISSMFITTVNSDAITRLQNARIAESLLIGEAAKDFSFNIYKGGYSPANKYQSSNANTYIIIHGYRSDIGGADPEHWVQEMAANIVSPSNDPNAQVLLLDWSDVVDHINIKADARNIKEIANILAIKLHQWKINPAKTTIIGHSLGTLMGATLSKAIEPNGGVKALIALDPAGFVSYEIAPGENFDGFVGKAKKTMCIIGSFSILGNKSFADDCDESFLIDFTFEVDLFWGGVVSVIKSTFKEHGGVHRIYRGLLSGNTLYNKALAPSVISALLNLPDHDKIQARDEQFRTIDIDGVLTLPSVTTGNSNATQLQYLAMKKGSKAILMGSEVDNEFECTHSTCDFYGWRGLDKFNISNRSSDFSIKDFIAQADSDKLLIRDAHSVSYNKNPNNSVTLRVYYNGAHYSETILNDILYVDFDKWMTRALDANIKNEFKINDPIQIK